MAEGRLSVPGDARGPGGRPIAEWLVTRSAYQPAPAFYIMAAAVISFVALLGFRETARGPLA